MLKESLIEIFERDLNKLKIEIGSYEDESKLWIIDHEIKNSGGNLCLHLIGNLKQFIGKVLGKYDYNRNRDAEFSNKNVPKKDLIDEIEETKNVVIASLKNIDEGEFDKKYPVNVYNNDMTTGFFLVSLVAHLNYHLGQINYHRRIIGLNK